MRQSEEYLRRVSLQVTDDIVKWDVTRWLTWEKMECKEIVPTDVQLTHSHLYGWLRQTTGEEKKKLLHTKSLT